MPLKSSDYDRLDDGCGFDINPFTQMASNPAKSEKQARFMRMCAHSPGKARGKCPSKKVAREFMHT